ncbi:major facilitator superfamily domain-containing protein [Xylaria intraflava]|nr:major facilitator superfamily domain-containing protein [Xylaria intraflava]
MTAISELSLEGGGRLQPESSAGLSRGDYNAPNGENSNATLQDDGPKGGLRAWLYVLAVFFIYINSWGFVQSFGAFEDIYVRTLLPNTSASAVSWIGSVQNFLFMFVGAFAGPLFDAGYLRPLIWVGCFLIVLGTATLSLATTYWQIFLAQSLAVGLGSGLVYVPLLAFISTLFPESTRPLAIGFSSLGGSVGNIIYTFMLRELLPSIGFPWTVRAMVLTNIVSTGLALVILLPYRPSQASNRRSVLDLHALREPNFLLFSIAYFLSWVAVLAGPVYTATYATIALGESRSFGLECLVYMCIGSAIGRTLPMLVAYRFGSIQVYVTGTISMAAILFAWMAVYDAAGLVTFALLFGIVFGIVVTAPSAAVSHPSLSPDIKSIGTRLGMLCLFGAFGALIGTPIFGALMKGEPGPAGFRSSQGFAGAAAAGAFLLLIVPMMSAIRYDSKEKAARTNKGGLEKS